jgi:hypothetical protein
MAKTSGLAKVVDVDGDDYSCRCCSVGEGGGEGCYCCCFCQVEVAVYGCRLQWQVLWVSVFVWIVGGSGDGTVDRVNVGCCASHLATCSAFVVFGEIGVHLWHVQDEWS